MPPILQTLITLTIRILLCLLLLSEMSLAVRDYAAHVGNVFFVIFRRVFGRVLL